MNVKIKLWKKGMIAIGHHTLQKIYSSLQKNTKRHN